MKTRKKSFWQHPSGIFLVLSQHLFSVKLVGVVVVVVVEAVVIARKVFHASMHVKQLRAGGLEVACVEKTSRTDENSHR